MRLQITTVCLVMLIWPVLASEKMLYGKDDRYDVKNYPIKIFRELAESTAAAIDSYRISKHGFSRYKINAKTLKEELNLCPGSRFEEQISAAICTGVLIAKDKILTAGHCVQDMYACEELKWVFGFESSSDILSKNQIYSCKKILAKEANDNNQLDYAIIQLDRDVTGRDPVFAARESDLGYDDELVVIGHPSGLPLKIADGGFVREFYDTFFQANLDTFVYNSGSPVYDKSTAKLQGILVRGDTDYSYDFEKQCTTLNRTGNNNGRGEDVIPLSAIPKLGKYLD